MDAVLHGCSTFTVPYIDDVLVFSTSWKNHLNDLMQRFKDAGLTAKPAKCLWGKRQLEYLGHLVGDGKMLVPDAKVKDVRDYKRPRTCKQLRSFLGLMGYYRKYIRDYASIAKPLYKATHRDAPDTVIWTQEALVAFSKLNVSLCDACILHLPVPADNFILQTDASYVGLSGCLSVCREKQELPVMFYSRQLKPAETRYMVSEIECLAAVEAI